MAKLNNKYHNCFTPSRCLNRIRDRLGSWLAEQRMQREFGDQFRCCQIVLTPGGTFHKGLETLEAIRLEWASGPGGDSQCDTHEQL